MRHRPLRRARPKVEATARDWVSAGTDWTRIGVAKQHPRHDIDTPCEFERLADGSAGSEQQLNLSQAKLV